MAQATEEQKLQFIAKISTATDRRKWDGAKLQICMEDPMFDERLAAYINASEKPVEVPAVMESLIINLSDLREPKFPDWSKGRILIGVKEPSTLDIGKLIETAYFHERQTGNQTRPTGHEILASLVKSYKVGEDEMGKTYQVEPDDAINGHHGLKELLWLEQNWKTLPEAFRKWANGKLLYGHRDIVRRDDGYLSSPYLHCSVRVPCVHWYGLDGQWVGSEPGLREQVNA
jgi:hypothetical protein